MEEFDRADGLSDVANDILFHGLATLPEPLRNGARAGGVVHTLLAAVAAMIERTIVLAQTDAPVERGDDEPSVH